MKRAFSMGSLRGISAFLAIFVTFSTFAALQEVSVIGPTIGAPPNGDGDSFAPIVSPDGRYVLFASTANNLALPPNSALPMTVTIPYYANVYLRDRLNGTTSLVSVNLAGNGGADGNSFPTGLSTNGQYALFESTATNLVANDTLYTNKVFLRDVVNGITRLVSITPNGTNGNGVSRGSTLTPDGRYVAFVSTATNLVANTTNGIANVFVRDMLAGTTVLASVGAINNPALTANSATYIISSSEAPEITPDGRYVAFYSTATNLVPGVPPSVGEVYVRDLVGGITLWASTNAQMIAGLNNSSVYANVGLTNIGICYNQAISDNGQYVAFEISSNIWGASPSGFILRNNLQTGYSDIVSTNAAVAAGACQTRRSLNMTPDGQTIVYVATNGPAYQPNYSSCVNLWNSTNGTLLASGNAMNGITPGANVYSPDVDLSGRYVVFYTTDTNLTGTTNGGICLRDTQAATTTLVSVDTGASLAVDPDAVPALAGNGQYVAFESPPANVGGWNYFSDVFIRNVSSNAAELVSVHAPTLPSLTANGSSALWPGSVSSNGQFVAFSSWANNLTPNDSNNTLNVFVRDLVNETNILVSVATNGVDGDGMSTQPAISGNGRYVAFASVATNLMYGDSNFFWQIFVRDLQGGTDTLVSANTSGGFGDGDSTSPSISADGRFVLFTSLATNLVANTYAGGSSNLFLTDLQLGQTYALTTSNVLCYAMTPDGHYVGLVEPVPNSSVPAFDVWSSLAAAIVYSNAPASFTNFSISLDGQWIAYASGNHLYAENLPAQTNLVIASGNFSSRAGLQFSANNQYLAYAVCTNSFLAPPINNVYLYEFAAASNVLLSQSYLTGVVENATSDSPVISPDGRFVAYRSYASNLAPGNSNSVPDLFLYDRLSQITTLVSANLAGTGTGDNRSLMPVFSADSQTLAFESWASDLAPQDFTAGSDIFALGLSAYESSESQSNSVLTLQPELIFAAPPGLVPGQSLLVTWPYTPGTGSYSVQYKNNLTDPVWQNLNGNFTVIGNQIYITDPSPSSSQRFYRIVLNN